VVADAMSDWMTFNCAAIVHSLVAVRAPSSTR
jgi:hypothetical protein